MSGHEVCCSLSASRKLAPVESRPMNSIPPFGRRAPGLSPPTDIRRAAGFNLVELLVVMTIAAILMGIGVPSYRYVTNANRVSSEVNDLLGDMMVARAEAIRQGMTVSICPANGTGTACANATTDWSQGWIVFTDFNANGTVDAAAPQNDTVLRYQKPFSGTDSFQISNANGLNAVSFNRDGFATGLNPGIGQQLLFTLNAPAVNGTVNPQWRRCLQVSFAGMMTTEHSGIQECP